MQARKKLELDALAVDSFATAEESGERGTVLANQAAAKGCTCQGTCLCPTAYYNCGTGPYTIYSCDYTANASCHTV
jgi:hypothetical protein